MYPNSIISFFWIRETLYSINDKTKEDEKQRVN